MGVIEQSGVRRDRPDLPIAGEFSYDKAFSRHRGLISLAEQEKLRRSRVAIVGMGGVGGIHLITLTRLGIGSFHIADPDTFELANFNRQFGATLRGLGHPKVEVMADEAHAINPELEIRTFREPIGPGNIDAFLEGVDVVVDGIDFFEIETRRLFFREARRRGIWALTAGPIGFSAASIVFSPTGMSFDDYFDLHEGMGRLDQLVAFLVGLTPKATHRSYTDFSEVDTSTGRGPSAGLACHLCSGVAAAEILKILLDRRSTRPAPCFAQFDAYHQRLAKGRIAWGNRNPWQRLKRKLVKASLIRLGLADAVSDGRSKG
ncbi:ThiF family adenylyltransferase [Tundrisphaera lichenicola]|uniref:ThiF family adenylyltransferase n=1 Tax=Tundrisphaera lichenicola TaxID=2029860 RepID=UPI003EBE7534